MVFGSGGRAIASSWMAPKRTQVGGACWWRQFPMHEDVLGTLPTLPVGVLASHIGGRWIWSGPEVLMAPGAVSGMGKQLAILYDPILITASLTHWAHNAPTGRSGADVWSVLLW
ncbi:hypothetical protein GGTG_11924 [Gaeumannomyces tritici R3-111a-1]|uniref:Uncharacterized protein n=1 Tax=Gaeumannomyces tritici (strain R3-111a-1) TaxID=644352 RepID=J3PEJ3_GAET3|nr:hypothetical protein GGTG_11924 [Gaeumannomyces tritici R3-111a-1]EJT70901.1 hypothetical protein GGTG_11924 [Gaeumannomyces tritici R3-111a-1]